ncbi:hypothetical protein [Mesorhizobium sp.]|uniref:hypothetical protein n=1 Tax=Mesorhizobium sp. TaxID=1871066 RepID=UPI0012185D9B|nr:hypothetical protein [Mesorhizobium sp.]TIX28862.1 MAG: hypothetical protein E5V35_00440 [Mesorhizobium sp.]
MAKLKPHERLRFSSMGKLFELTAWFADDNEANAYIANHPDEGVIASTVDGLVLIANVRTDGVRYTTKTEG